MYLAMGEGKGKGASGRRENGRYMENPTHHRVAQLLRGLLCGRHRSRVAGLLHAGGDRAHELLVVAEAAGIGGVAVAGGGARDAGDEAVWRVT